MALPKVLRITHSTDNTTIVNNDQIVTVKDIAIDGILADLASVRGQIGNAKEMPDLDFDTLTTPGNYRITGYPTNGPSLPLNISGASIGSLIVTGIPGQNGRIFQIMISDSTITYRTILTSTEETWSAWKQLFSGNKVGDGIRVTNGIISVPEYDGATASTAGTSGLVPPATAGQQNHLLTGGGTYISKIPSATHADTADNSLALSGRPWLESLYTDSAGWIIGSVDEKLRPVNTGSLKVLAAERIHSSSFYYGRTATGFSLPNGGSWFIFSILDNDLDHSSQNAVPTIVAGGTAIGWSYNGTGYTWIGIKVL